MLGAIAGDVIGSIYERNPVKREDFELFGPGHCFTDDTVLTVAIADCLLSDGSYEEALVAYHARYPYAGYGGSFQQWARDPGRQPYGSWGNGSAMRVSPVGFAASSLDEACRWAQLSAAPTHNHPEGIKGAQATAASVFLARKGLSKDDLKRAIQSRFGYDLQRTLADIRPTYQFDVSCQGSVPEAIIAFLESTGVEDAIRKAISLGGDSDTMACIAGGIAEAHYGGVPLDTRIRTLACLDLRLTDVVRRFYETYMGGWIP